ncbi:Transposable element Tcb2 transposase [Ceratobasidium sp. AG-Ba]|nr:Transposable element Tcb2 transposase [Ceratobasidium sp. AG-Ba]
MNGKEVMIPRKSTGRPRKIHKRAGDWAVLLVEQGLARSATELQCEYFPHKLYTWSELDWAQVAFSDESKFLVFGYSGPDIYWKEVGGLPKPEHFKQVVKFGGGSVMVWGYIMFHVRRKDVIFQQDNDPKHTSRHTTKWFIDHGIEKRPWPSNSPDMNPIEHV